jgi:methylenetetrahydrofolate--tRNA-(uracil-5-)-methyltransferase
VGLYLGQLIKKQKILNAPPTTTALGALIAHILKADPKDYQPMNINFGLFKELEGRFKKTAKKTELVRRASEDLREWLKF